MSAFKRDISIALCTCNGEKYLEEQLWSIARQSFRPMELVVSDDQSTDATVEIVENFKIKSPFEVKINKNKIKLGVINNFVSAINKCKGNYIAFSDQDDLWLPDKLALSYRAMKDAEMGFGKETPILVHSDLIVATAGGDVIDKSFKKFNGIKFTKNDPLKNLLVQNFVTGCTVLANLPLIKLAIPFPKDVVMHDWWLALIAAAKGKIISLCEPTVIYRQHSFNLIGAKSFYSYVNARRLTNIRDLERDLAAVLSQALTLRNRLTVDSEYSIPEYMDKFIMNAQKNGIRTALTALRYDIKKNPWSRNIFFILLLIKGGYLNYMLAKR